MKELTVSPVMDFPSEIKREPFACAQCSLSFSEISELEEHAIAKHSEAISDERSEDKPEEITCEVKVEDYFSDSDTEPNGANLENHVQKLQPDDENLFPCDQCPKKYASWKLLKFHFKQVHAEKKYACSLCPKRFGIKGLLAAHERGQHPTEKVKCETCGKLFQSAYTLKIHVNNVHKSIRNYACSFCQKPFYNISGLTKHEQQVHLKTPSLQCKICLELFVTERKVMKHTIDNHYGDQHAKFLVKTKLRTKSRAAVYECGKCCTYQSTKCYVKYHLARNNCKTINQEHEEPQPSEFIADETLEDQPEEITCEVSIDQPEEYTSDLSIDQAEEITSKILIDQPKEITSEVSIDQPEEIPSEVLIDKPEETTSEVIIDEPEEITSEVSIDQPEEITCDVSIDNYMSDSDTEPLPNEANPENYVQNLQPDNENPFQCNKCPKKYSSAKILKFHFLQKHAEKTYACSKCPKKFGMKCLLLAHEREQHTNKTVKCEICGQLLKSAITLKNHIANFHNSAKSFICSYCQKPFHNISVLTKHEQGVHLKTKSLQCKICLVLFESERKVMKHTIDNHYNEEHAKLLVKTAHRTRSRSVLYECGKCSDYQSTKCYVKYHLARNNCKKFKD